MKGDGGGGDEHDGGAGGMTMTKMVLNDSVSFVHGRGMMGGVTVIVILLLIINISRPVL